MFRFPDPITLVETLAAVLIAATVHEFAHALIADRLGDPTARHMGRLSLNPIVHLDPLGTIFFVLMGFGWAKPVPVNPRNFHDPRGGMLQVAVAGPLANITMAFVLGMLLKVPGLVEAVWAPFLALVIWINIVLAIFNLIPIPPLDGSRILAALLPAQQSYAFSRLQPYGTLVLLLLLYTGIVGRVMMPAVRWLFLTSTGGPSM